MQIATYSDGQIGNHDYHKELYVKLRTTRRIFIVDKDESFPNAFSCDAVVLTGP